MNTATKRQLSNHAAVAKLCKQYLKSRGIECQTRSSSYSMGDSVSVYVSNQPPSIMAEIEAEFAKYEYGQFNGMEDIYEYTNRRDDVPQTKYLNIENRYSDEVRQAAWDFVRAHFSGAEDCPEDLNSCSSVRVWNDYADTIVYRLLNGASYPELSAQFWATIR